VTDDARAVVEHAQQHRRDPPAVLREQLARTMMEIEMPENELRGILWRMQSSGICGAEFHWRSQASVSRSVPPVANDHRAA
jgi:hypothetical protein